VLEHLLGNFRQSQEQVHHHLSTIKKIEDTRQKLTVWRLKLRRNINLSLASLIGGVIIITSLIGPDRYPVFVSALVALLIGQIFIFRKWFKDRRSLSAYSYELSELDAEARTFREEVEQITNKLGEVINLLEQKPRGSE